MTNNNVFNGVPYLALLFVGLAMLDAKPVVAAPPAFPPLSVDVVNAASSPVPVAGVIQAQQAGPWSVGLAGTPNIIPTLGQTVALQFAVTRQPLTDGGFATVRAPNGQRLIVETVSVQGFTYNGSTMSYRVDVVPTTSLFSPPGASQASASIYMPQATPWGEGFCDAIGCARYNASTLQTHLCVDSGAELAFEFYSGDPNAAATFNIAGYLVPAN